RSFDHMLGKLSEQGQPDAEPFPEGFTNPRIGSGSFDTFHASTTCWTQDPGHQWLSMHAQVDRGKMDGFVINAQLSTTSDGRFVMSYYDRTDLPFYYWLASTFALNDRHFASVRSGTFPNRDYLLLGTSDGVMATGGGYPSPDIPTIFDSMDAAGV